MPSEPDAADLSVTARLRPFALGAFALALPLGIAAQQGALAILACLFVAECVRARRLPPSPLDLPLALFLAALLVSTAFCPDPWRSLRAYDRLWIVLGFFATFHLTRTEADVER